MFQVTKKGNYLKVTSLEIEGTFTVSGGNSKVMYPIVSFSSATNCVNAGWCDYSAAVREKGDTVPLCYAQRIEKLRPNVLNSREENFHFVMEANRLGHLNVFAQTLAAHIWNWREPKYIRFNESGDLDLVNTLIICHMQEWFNENNKPCKMYGYSKSEMSLRNEIRRAGGVVMNSDIDFIVVRDRKEARQKGLVVCPGECGPGSCTRCMSQQTTAVIAH